MGKCGWFTKKQNKRGGNKKDGMALLLIPEGGLHSSKIGYTASTLSSVIKIISLPAKIKKEKQNHSGLIEMSH